MKTIEPSLRDDVQNLCAIDQRYRPDAYYFVVEALDVTVKRIRADQPGHGRHITARELLEGVRNYALDEFGPMAYTVLTEWGLRTTADFGEIVYNMIHIGRFGKTDDDKKEDFQHVYTFEEAFLEPYQ